MELNGYNQSNVVLYIIPFKSSGREIQGDSFVLANNLVLRKECKNINYFRNLVSESVKKRIEELTLYELFDIEEEEADVLSLQSFAFIKSLDESGEPIFRCKETNLDDIVDLKNIYVYRFDNDYQYLVLRCLFKCDQEDISKFTNNITKAHAHIINNYFKCYRNNEVIEGEKYDITDDDLKTSAFLKICYKSGDTINEYYFSSEAGNVLGQDVGITFDFSQYHIRALTQVTVPADSTDVDLLAEQLSTGSINPILKDREGAKYKNRKYSSISSGFGSSFVFPISKDIAPEILEKTIVGYVRSFYNEYLYDFLIALNYHLRVEDHYNIISSFSYVAKDSSELKRMLHEIDKYNLDVGKYYFATVSRLEYVNSYYRSLVIGLGTRQLTEELEFKIKHAYNYLTSTMDSMMERENRFMSFFIGAVALAGNVGLFIMTLLQVAGVLSSGINQPAIIVALIASAILIVFSIVICTIFAVKKSKIKRKYGKD